MITLSDILDEQDARDLHEADVQAGDATYSYAALGGLARELAARLTDPRGTTTLRGPRQAGAATSSRTRSSTSVSLPAATRSRTTAEAPTVTITDRAYGRAASR